MRDKLQWYACRQCGVGTYGTRYTRDLEITDFPTLCYHMHNDDLVTGIASKQEALAWLAWLQSDKKLPIPKGEGSSCDGRIQR